MMLQREADDFIEKVINLVSVFLGFTPLALNVLTQPAKTDKVGMAARTPVNFLLMTAGQVTVQAGQRTGLVVTAITFISPSIPRPLRRDERNPIMMSKALWVSDHVIVIVVEDPIVYDATIDARLT